MVCYEVWAVRWNSDRQELENFKAGEFYQYSDAALFAEAYKAKYSSSATIYDTFKF